MRIVAISILGIILFFGITLNNNRQTLPSVSFEDTPAPTKTLIPNDVSPVSAALSTDDSINTTPTNTARPTSTQTCSPQTDWAIYVVQAGDSLSTISRSVNSTIDELTTANCLENPNAIRRGQELYVPRLSVTETPQPTLPPTATQTIQATRATSTETIQNTPETSKTENANLTYTSDAGFAFDYPPIWTLIEADENRLILTSYIYNPETEIPRNQWDRGYGEHDIAVANEHLRHPR